MNLKFSVSPIKIIFGFRSFKASRYIDFFNHALGNVIIVFHDFSPTFMQTF